MSSQATKFKILRGEASLGFITQTHDDFPWHYGDFEASPAFHLVENLFKKELGILEETKGNEKWDAAYREISAEGLRLEPVGPGKIINNPLLHIRGNVAWWR